MRRLAALTIAAFVALAAPAAGVPGKDKPDRPDKPGKGSKGVAYVFKGSYGSDSDVAVDHTNKHARSFDEETVEFDFSEARIKVADTDGNGTADLADVAAGDRVVVKAKLAKRDPGPQPFAARQLVDQTHPPGYEAETG